MIQETVLNDINYSELFKIIIKNKNRTYASNSFLVLKSLILHSERLKKHKHLKDFEIFENKVLLEFQETLNNEYEAHARVKEVFVERFPELFI